MEESEDTSSEPSTFNEWHYTFRRRILPIVIVVVIVLICIGLQSFGQQDRLPAEDPHLATWQLWGMTIQYPLWGNADFAGINGHPANSTYGVVYWTWNNDLTTISLGWAPALNTSEEFQSIYGAEQGIWINLTLIDQGNITMGGATWQYQTSQCIFNDKTEYLTIALSEYPKSQRIYTIFFEDSLPDTLSALEYYGNTFSG